MRLSIIPEEPDLYDRALSLSDRLNLPVIDIRAAIAERGELALWVTHQGLTLREPSVTKGGVRVDFVVGKARHRKLYGGGQGQDIARAIGISGSFKPSVLDLTAGLGRDAFVVASLGASVHMVERHPVVFALLEDGLLRARCSATDVDGSAEVVSRMTLQESPGLEALATIEENGAPDVIYLDPMFPPRNKSAKVKQEMAFFHRLVGEDSDSAELLARALEQDCYRVVVKRAVSAGFLGDIKPGHSIVGKTTRFDVYTLKKLPK